MPGSWCWTFNTPGDQDFKCVQAEGGRDGEQRSRIIRELDLGRHRQTALTQPNKKDKDPFSQDVSLLISKSFFRIICYNFTSELRRPVQNAQFSFDNTIQFAKSFFPYKSEHFISHVHRFSKDLARLQHSVL